MPKVKRYAVFSPQKDGNAWRWQGRSIDTASGQDAKINFAQDARRTAVMDVNGDGLVDVVFAGATEYQTFFALGRYPGGDGQFGHARWTGAETADLSDEPATARRGAGRPYAWATPTCAPAISTATAYLTWCACARVRSSTGLVEETATLVRASVMTARAAAWLKTATSRCRTRPRSARCGLAACS